MGCDPRLRVLRIKKALGLALVSQIPVNEIVKLKLTTENQN